MLEDVVRTTAYDEALRRTVKPGARVIDFGSGTGVMAIFAARHGAGVVDAIERTEFVERARRIAARSGHPEIRFHHADHESFRTDGRADVLVSEWMGHLLFYEAMLEPLLQVRDRWLAEDGVMVPKRVSSHAGLVTDPRAHEGLSFLMGKPYGLDFGEIADVPLRQPHLVNFEPDQLLDSVIELGTLDMKTIERQPTRLVGSGYPSQNATVYGIAAWFSMELCDDFVVGTGPFDPETHWQQVYFPFLEPIEVSTERELTIVIWPPTESEDDQPTWKWSLSDGETTVFTDSAEPY
jgi:SAM-dependent methyltransferase